MEAGGRHLFMYQQTWPLINYIKKKKNLDRGSDVCVQK
jgi:hypothetical protein